MPVKAVDDGLLEIDGGLWTVPLETSSTPMMVLMKGAQQAKFLSSFWMCYPVA